MSQTIPVPIFVADDDADDRLLIRDAFEESGRPVRLTFFQDGAAILAGLTDALDRQALPQLILMDLNMPRMNGREVIAELKADPLLRHIPVIVLTTSSDESDIAACYGLGANSYIVKPVSYNGLLDITRSLKHYWMETSVLPGHDKSHA